MAIFYECFHAIPTKKFDSSVVDQNFFFMVYKDLSLYKLLARVVNLSSFSIFSQLQAKKLKKSFQEKLSRAQVEHFLRILFFHSTIIYNSIIQYLIDIDSPGKFCSEFSRILNTRSKKKNL